QAVVLQARVSQLRSRRSVGGAIVIAFIRESYPERSGEGYETAQLLSNGLSLSNPCRRVSTTAACGNSRGRDSRTPRADADFLSLSKAPTAPARRPSGSCSRHG